MGGQLGSCFLCFGIVQQHRKNIPPEDLRFLGGPRRREESGGTRTLNPPQKKLPRLHRNGEY